MVSLYCAALGVAPCTHELSAHLCSTAPKRASSTRLCHTIHMLSLPLFLSLSHRAPSSSRPPAAQRSRRSLTTSHAGWGWPPARSWMSCSSRAAAPAQRAQQQPAAAAAASPHWQRAWSRTRLCPGRRRWWGTCWAAGGWRATDRRRWRRCRMTGGVAVGAAASSLSRCAAVRKDAGGCGGRQPASGADA